MLRKQWYELYSHQQLNLCNLILFTICLDWLIFSNFSCASKLRIARDLNMNENKSKQNFIPLSTTSVDSIASSTTTSSSSSSSILSQNVLNKYRESTVHQFIDLVPKTNAMRTSLKKEINMILQPSYYQYVKSCCNREVMRPMGGGHLTGPCCIQLRKLHHFIRFSLPFINK